MPKAIGTLYGFLRRLIHLFYCPFVDFVFIHRELTPLGPPIFEWIIARMMHKKIIYDFDDAIWMVNISVENRLVSGLKWHRKFFSICKWSYKISCCNEFLAENAGRFNTSVFILPTTLDSRKFVKAPKKNHDDCITIGWTGTHSTLAYLSPIIGVIKNITEQNPNIVFRIICNKEPEWEMPNMQFVRWNKDTEVEDLSGIDIGLMPLPATDWARGKCGFKILEYFSMGIPAIASPVGINKEIIHHGINGYLCTNEREWKEHINLLLESKGLRDQMGQNGRRMVRKAYSPEVYNTIFLGLFE